MKRVISYNRGELQAPEVRMSLGPQILADPQDGSYDRLYGAPRAAVLDRDYRLITHRLVLGVWTQEEVVQLPEGAEHIAICYDQSARLVYAYELASGIYISQFDGVLNQYVLRGPFDGHDPLLMNDSYVSRTVGDTDIKLIHLTLNRQSVRWREQREQYSVSRPIFTFASAKRLDQVVYLTTQFALTLSDLNGELSADILLSDSYPFPQSEPLRMIVEPEGTYIQTTTTFANNLDQLGMAVGVEAVYRSSNFNYVDDHALDMAVGVEAAYKSNTFKLDDDDSLDMAVATEAKYVQTTQGLTDTDELDMTVAVEAVYRRV
jgi:hypothetical protein